MPDTSPCGPAAGAGLGQRQAPEAHEASRPVQGLMAFDHGLRRVGVAVGNTLLGHARPLCTLAVKGEARFAAIAQLLQEWQPDTLVVGVPCHPDGTPHENTRRARRFARQLCGRFGLPVLEVDERWSTTEAISQGGAGRDVDARAAAVILDQYLRSQASHAAA